MKKSWVVARCCQRIKRNRDHASRIMLLSLPEPLESAIAATLKGVPTSQWVSAAQQLSARYRGERLPSPSGVGASAGRPGRSEGRTLARGEVAALGYAALILPAAYAQLHGAMTATAARVPA